MKILLLGKTAFQKLVIGLDVATGIVVIAGGKVIEAGDCFSNKELITRIFKILRNVIFEFTSLSIKIGNGVPFCKEMFEGLDNDLLPRVALKVVGETGTNKPLIENKCSRRVRHISSVILIAGRNGEIISRRKIFATHSRIQ